MRVSSVLLLLFAAHPAYAIPTKDLGLGKGGLAHVRASDEEGARLEFDLPGGRTQREEELGEQFVPLREGDAQGRTGLRASDLDHDGQEELLARTKFAGGGGDSLYVFVYDAKKRRFRAAPAEGGEDFISLESRDAVNLEADGRIEVASAKGARAYRLTGAKLSSTTATPPADASPPKTLPLPLELRGCKP